MPIGDIRRKLCRGCDSELPVEAFGKNGSRKDGLTDRCRACTRAYYTPERKRAEYERNRVKHLERAKQYRQKARYGLEPGDYERMLAEQGGRCALCEAEPAKLYIDHDHRSGKARKLLCPRCNTLVGYLESTSDELLERVYGYINGGRSPVPDPS